VTLTIGDSRRPDYLSTYEKRNERDGGDARRMKRPPTRHQPSDWCEIMTISFRFSPTCL